MKAKNIPETGFFNKKYPLDEPYGADAPTDCDMLSETDTIDMTDDDDLDLEEDNSNVDTDNLSPSAKLDVLKEACDSIMKINPPITDEEEDTDS